MKFEDYEPLVTLMLLEKFLSASQFNGCIILHVYCILPASSPDILTWLSVQDNHQQRTGGLPKSANMKTQLSLPTWIKKYKQYKYVF